MGLKEYTATFTNEAFATQAKTVEMAIDLDAHDWGRSNMYVVSRLQHMYSEKNM